MTNDVETNTERHYNVTGRTSDIPSTVREALKHSTNDEDEDRTWHIVLWQPPFGYQLTAEFSDDGICHQYKAKKTGYDGDFRVEGRGYTNDVLRILEMFFKTGPQRVRGDRPNGRHFRMRDGRLVAYWSTLSPARLNSDDFGKTF